MNTITTDQVVEVAQAVQQIVIESRLKQFQLQGGAMVARQAHNLKVVGSIPAPATNLPEPLRLVANPANGIGPVPNGDGPIPLLVISQLVNLFELHGGRIPTRELMAENMPIAQLIAWNLIVKSPCAHDGDVYLSASGLNAAIKVV